MATMPLLESVAETKEQRHTLSMRASMCTFQISKLHAKARLLNERVLLMGVLVHLLPLDKACTKRKEQKAILESLHSDMMPQALGSRDVQ